ncbi:MAG: hypothetical protein F6J87_10460 [Spirulina sp. SIO3F2]|nr:hypothetical protein [Spirulina sp. SIO3F2]
MVQSVSSKNTKAEIIAAFRELQKANKTLQAELEKRPEPTPAAPAPIAPTDAPKSSEKTAETISANLQQTLEKLAAVQVGFGGAVSNLSEQLISEASSLSDLQAQVTEIIDRLAQLHEVETITDQTLETMIVDYEQSAKTFAEELETSQETLEQELQDLQVAWQKEQETQQRDRRERDETTRKDRQREEQDYQYDLELERNKSDEAYEQAQKQLYQELADLRETQEKAWEEREKAIAEQEKEYAEAKEKVEAFETELEEKKTEGKESGRKIGHYNAKVKSDLRTKEIEGERQNYLLRIEGFENTISSNESRIQVLSKKLDATLKQVQDLAAKAIEGRANRAELESLKAITSELAKGQSKNSR